MITSITMRKIASYDDDGVQIDNLRKINFIYGANGSGKTTISNFIANQADSKYQSCKVIWEHDLPLKILVYNKKFREENFGKGTIEGIFTLEPV